MRKALLPMLVSLALCGAATTAMVMSSARAEPGPHKPLMVAVATSPDMQLAANDAPPDGAPPRNLRQRSPEDTAARMKQMCNDGYARQAAQLTYLETSLQLTASERPLFERWKDAKLNIGHRHADRCAQRATQRGASADRPGRDAQDRSDSMRPSPADQMARQEDRLKERLADLQAERPALEAFYNALSPAQKMQMARGALRDGMDRRMGERGRDGMVMRPHMFADAGRRGAMGGPMGERPMGPPPPDAPPPER
jgi:hypothetical protein